MDLGILPSARNLRSYTAERVSIRTLDQGLCSGDGVKEYGSPMFPHLEFVGWQSEDSVRSFIDRIKSQLNDEAWSSRIDMLIPPEAISMLHKRLTGRFRPIVTAIEGIIATNDAAKWESIIANTEAMLSSWEDKVRRGNMIGELLRTTNKIKNHPERFSSFFNIEDTLVLFFKRWYLLGETIFILKEEAALLVESALGRIKIFGGNACVAMDEPLVLKAVQNYFKQKDPLFVAAAERMMLTLTNPSEQAARQLIRYHLRAMAHLESIIDDNAPIPGIQEVLQAVQKVSDLCEARLPVLPGLKLSNKRQRQR
ncbi:hypothetical protein BX616_007460 [Lobosporangium transversale]|nr:hypothetical protein BX616_007460 [Lobosporangium transversale]